MSAPRPRRSPAPRRGAPPPTAAPTAQTFTPASTDFTEQLVGQLLIAITRVPSHYAGGISVQRVHPFLAASVGVSRTSTRMVVAVLTSMGLVTEADGALGRSVTGDKLRREVRDSGAHALALAVVRSGVMSDQIRSLRRVLQRNGDSYDCGRTPAQGAAPQLVGLLARMPDVTVGRQLIIGPATALELDSVWNELPPTSRVNWEDIEKRRKAIGDRAELYSVQLERSRQVGAFERINWVSRDDDALGYDIEVAPDAASGVTRFIEVKGSGGRKVLFYLSSNEYVVASKTGEAYELHFWGGIDIRRDPMVEYEELRQAGYPVRASAKSLLMS